jgi:hypothetical protein
MPKARPLFEPLLQAYASRHRSSAFHARRILILQFVPVSNMFVIREEDENASNLIHFNPEFDLNEIDISESQNGKLEKQKIDIS